MCRRIVAWGTESHACDRNRWLKVGAGERYGRMSACCSGKAIAEPKFGRDGKPFYINGPYDDLGRVLRTLRRAVGKDARFGDLWNGLIPRWRRSHRATAGRDRRELA